MQGQKQNPPTPKTEKATQKDSILMKKQDIFIIVYNGQHIGLSTCNNITFRFENKFSHFSYDQFSLFRTSENCVTPGGRGFGVNIKGKMIENMIKNKICLQNKGKSMDRQVPWEEKGVMFTNDEDYSTPIFLPFNSEIIRLSKPP